MKTKLQFLYPFFFVGLAFADDGMIQEKPDQVIHQEDEVEVVLGGGIVTMPKYPGSSDMEYFGIPLLSIQYDRFFLGGAPGSSGPGGLGVYLYENELLQLGVALSHDIEDPREDSDVQQLNDQGQIKASTHGTLFLSLEKDQYSLSASFSTDLGGNAQGSLAKLEAEARFQPSPKLLISAGPGITLVNGKHAQTFFGVDHKQGSGPGIDTYDADGGISEVEFSLGARYQIDVSLGLGANVTTGYLQGDAANSPVVESRTQNRYGVFIYYAFNL